MEENQKDFLADIVTESQLIQAGTGKRFLNFLIDYVVFIILFFCIIILWLILSPDTTKVLINGDYSLLVNIAALLLYGFYMSVIEALTKGRSLGKIITGTKAVNEDGSKITTGAAFKRGFSRAVPFEAFSALGSPSYPWHDKWNHTYVIDIKKSSVIADITETL
jgi:uncharacterized RDD family membrane protein YckC